MSTTWIPDSEFSWNLFVNGKNEQNEYEMVSVSAKNYEKYHVSNICLRVSAQPISMEKIMIGISPVSYSDLHLVQTRKVLSLKCQVEITFLE